MEVVFVKNNIKIFLFFKVLGKEEERNRKLKKL